MRPGCGIWKKCFMVVTGKDIGTCYQLVHFFGHHQQYNFMLNLNITRIDRIKNLHRSSLYYKQLNMIIRDVAKQYRAYRSSIITVLTNEEIEKVNNACKAMVAAFVAPKLTFWVQPI